MSDYLKRHGRLAFLGGATLTRAIRSIACPHSGCGAAPGEPCLMYGITLPIEHQARIERAKRESTVPNPNAREP